MALSVMCNTSRNQRFRCDTLHLRGVHARRYGMMMRIRLDHGAISVGELEVTKKCMGDVPLM